MTDLIQANVKTIEAEAIQEIESGEMTQEIEEMVQEIERGETTQEIESVETTQEIESGETTQEIGSGETTQEILEMMLSGQMVRVELSRNEQAITKPGMKPLEIVTKKGVK